MVVRLKEVHSPRSVRLQGTFEQVVNRYRVTPMYRLQVADYCNRWAVGGKQTLGRWVYTDVLISDYD